MSKLLALLSTLALASVAANAAAEVRENSYIVTYKNDVDAKSFGASLERAFERENAREGVKVEHKLERQFQIGSFKASAVQVDKSYLAKLKANSKVASIYPNRIVQAFGVQENPESWGCVDQFLFCPRPPSHLDALDYIVCRASLRSSASFPRRTRTPTAPVPMLPCLLWTRGCVNPRMLTGTNCPLLTQRRHNRSRPTTPTLRAVQFTARRLAPAAV